MARRARFLVALIPLAVVALVATRYSRSWYLSDEWRIIDRLVAPGSAHPNLARTTFEVYNGHLYSVPILAYRVQLAIGLEGHAFVWAAFCAALLACNVSVARLLWIAGVPALAAVVAGAAITYFGPGAQIATLEFQFGMVAGVALAFLAACTALRTPVSSARAAATIAIVLLVATAFDSGAASAGVVFLAVLLVLRWRDRLCWLALGPPVVANLAVLVAARSSPRWPGSLDTEVSVGVHLFLRAAGGLVGGSAVAGAFVTVVASVVFVPAIVSGRMSRDALHCLAAGLAAALVMTAVIARTRGGLIGHDWVDADRYIWLVAVFLLVALLPAAVSVAHALSGARAAWVGPVFAGLLAVVFVLNLGSLRDYRRTAEVWQTQTRVQISQAYVQIARGCPRGRAAPTDAQPLATLGNPWVTVQLLRDLESRGALHLTLPSGVVPDLIRSDTCMPRASS